MKNLFKLAPVALGLLALASCSNEDFMSKGNSELDGVKSLTVELADPVTDEPSMRSLFYDGNKLLWQSGDAMNVYDENLVKYDVFSYNTRSDKFSTKTSYVEDPVYVLFGDVQEYSGWRNTADGKEELYAVVNIDEEINFEDYPANSSATGVEVPAYLSNIPLFGKVTEFADGDIKGQMVYLTGWLKVELQNGKDNVKAIKVTSLTADDKDNAAMPLVGYFDAILDTEGEFAKTDANKSTLVKSNNKLFANSYKTSITVNTEKLGEFTSYVYIPVVAGTYPKLKVEYTADGSEWEELTTFEKKVIAAGHSYAKDADGETMQIMYEVTTEVTTLSELQELINEYAAKGKAVEITVNGSSQFEVTDDDNVLNIPTGAPALTVTFTQGLKKPSKGVVITGGENAGEFTMNIQGTLSNTQNKIDLKDYKGDISFPARSGLIEGQKAAGKLLTVDSGQSTVTGNGGDIAITGTVTAVTNKGNGNIEVAHGAKVETLTNGTGVATDPVVTGEIIVAGTVTALNQNGSGAITLVKTAIPQANNKVTYEYGKIGTLTISSANKDGVSGDGHIITSVTNASASPIALTIYDETLGAITSAGNVTIAGQLTDKGVPNGESKVANISPYTSGSTTTGGDVTIKNTTLADNAAITCKGNVVLDNVKDGSSTAIATDKNATIKVAQTYASNKYTPSTLTAVTFKGNLTLTAGILSSLTYNGTADCAVHTEGETAIETVTNSSSKKLTFTSTWDGTSAIASTSGNIYTAAQLAGIDNTASADYTLCTDIDLDGNNWASKALSKNFKGEANVSHVISGLSMTSMYKNGSSTATANAGLFSTIGTDVTEISGFEIKDAAIDVEVNNIGVLAGSSTATTLKIENVIVSGEIGSTKASAKGYAVGGLVGNAAGTVTIDGCTSKVTLDGYYGLGGFVGLFNGTKLEFGSSSAKTNNKATATFSVKYNNGKELDENCGKVGALLGSVSGGAVAISAKNEVIGGTNLTTAASREALKFDMNWVVIEKNHAYYHANRSEVGYSGTNNDTYDATSKKNMTFATGVTINLGYEAKPSYEAGDDVLYYYQ